LKTSPRDARIAERQEKWKETIVIEVSTAKIVGNQKEERLLFFFYSKCKVCYGSPVSFIKDPVIYQRKGPVQGPVSAD